MYDILQICIYSYRNDPPNRNSSTTSSNVAPVLGGQRCPKRSDEVSPPLGARGNGGGNGGSHGLPRHRGFDWRGKGLVFGGFDLQK